jgi:hypothetical protein
MNATPARLIVCERRGRWAVLLRQQLADAGVRVWETRLLSDCENEIVASPASVVVIELTASNLDEILRTVRHWATDFPLLRWIAVADRALADHQWLMREAGASHFCCSPRHADALAQVACRHLSQIPPPPQSLTERIWDSLPWQREGSTKSMCKDECLGYNQ